MKSQEITVTTSAGVERIKGVLAEVFRGASIEPLQSTTGGLLDTGPEPAVQLLAEKKTLAGLWAVQVYVFDQGEQREVRFIALGDSGASRAFHGIQHTASLSKSVKVAEQAAVAVRG